MSLAHLQINQVRNIPMLDVALHPRCNIIHGPNGSGKTSFLESIYLLGHGRSFRSRNIMPLITHGADAMTVFARTDLNETISIQKNTAGLTHVRLNQQSCVRSSELAHFLPSQVFYADLFQIIDAGPTIRRHLLDWGLFHVKQSYHLVWAQYRRLLKQRHALLRQKAPQHHFIVWDQQIVQLATQLDEMRAEYFITWSKAFDFFLAQLTDLSCTLQYFKGWDKKETGKSLEQILAEQWVTDRQRLYTQSGAHHADILFTGPHLHAKHTLSRGQQKIILIALKLAQASLFPKACIYLLDDITAELDTPHIKRLIQCLHTLPGQFFFTSLDQQLISTWELDHTSIEFWRAP